MSEVPHGMFWWCLTALGTSHKFSAKEAGAAGAKSAFNWCP
jgi:hypothetical protein